MKKEMSEIKKRALLAKQRLKMGYWQQMERAREQMEKVNVDERSIAMFQQAKIKRDFALASDNQRAKLDEELYQKVCFMLDTNPDETAPIGRLIDKEIYMSLDEGGKQRYVLELSKKFRELSERYYSERANKSC
jgi:hypothetical protein